MRELAVYDYKNYKENGTVGKRPSARGIIIREGKIAMVHSLKYDYYKFPGGGIEPGETMEQALIRETREEAGLAVLEDSTPGWNRLEFIEKTRHIIEEERENLKSVI